MKSPFRLPAVVALGLLLASCASVTVVDPGKTVSVGNGVSVSPQGQWNQITLNGHTIWTQNGLPLDTLHFLTGIKPGKPLYPVPKNEQGPQNSFALNMLPNDVQDLIVTTMQREGYTNVRAGNLAPCPYGMTTGFCFDLDFVTQDGLAMKGKVLASKRADSLDVFEFLAPSEYYFDALSPDVKQIFASVEIK